MTAIRDAANQIPMMFRAQVNGRCQLQRIDPTRKATGERPRQKQDAEIWAEELTDQVYPMPPQFDGDVRSSSPTQITWRFVTNGGQDDGVIRPVIGARGYPFYPGSSMKGLFRQACTSEQADLYCGSEDALTPGILRFHGGYPINDQWTNQLVDIVHPQQGWQVKTQDTHSKPGGESGFVQLSLYKPKLQFGISSTIPLTELEWKTIWKIWQQALSLGIGCRVCAGYGRIDTAPRSKVIYRAQVHGEGASQLLDGSSEFRPNIFRAALRGHAFRIFGGLINQESKVTQLINTLFGGIEDETKQGLVSMTFRETNLQPKNPGRLGLRQYAVDAYDIEGEVIWSLTRSLPEPEKIALQRLIRSLLRFAMLLGGFGKSWRRASHRLFYRSDYEKPIGCHWQWAGESLGKEKIRNPEQITSVIEKVRRDAVAWIQEQQWVDDVTPNLNLETPVPWREAWHRDTVEVWVREAGDSTDCKAIDWLHRPYQLAEPRFRIPRKEIKGTSVTGRLGRNGTATQIGRLWHRMYSLGQNGEVSEEYLEVLTVFPDDSQDFKDFLDFLDTKPHDFEKRWPIGSST